MKVWHLMHDDKGVPTSFKIWKEETPPSNEEIKLILKGWGVTQRSIENYFSQGNTKSLWEVIEFKLVEVE